MIHIRSTCSAQIRLVYEHSPDDIQRCEKEVVYRRVTVSRDARTGRSGPDSTGFLYRSVHFRLSLAHHRRPRRGMGDTFGELYTALTSPPAIGVTVDVPAASHCGFTCAFKLVGIVWVRRCYVRTRAPSRIEWLSNTAIYGKCITICVFAYFVLMSHNLGASSLM